MKTKVEKNRLIAEFMGYTTRPGYPDEYYKQDIYYMGLVSVFRYDSSWEELMPVIKKINEVANEWDFDTDERDMFEEIFNIDNTFSEFLNNDIEEILNRVINFIEYYNNLDN